jgi:hypothetical protein
MEAVFFFINVGMALHGVTTQNNNVILAADRTSNLPSNNIGYYHLVCTQSYRVFQKSLYRKSIYKNHLPLKYCITKIVQNVCTCVSSLPHSWLTQLGLQFEQSRITLFFLVKRRLKHTVFSQHFPVRTETQNNKFKFVSANQPWNFIWFNFFKR